MPEAALNLDLGRCSTCGQLVTLPPQARERRVACPKCGHQAEGGAFGPLAAPLPVILVSRSQGGADGLEFQTTTDCRFFHIIAKRTVTEVIGCVSAVRRRAIGRKINEVLRLQL